MTRQFRMQLSRAYDVCIIIADLSYYNDSVYTIVLFVYTQQCESM